MSHSKLPYEDLKQKAIKEIEKHQLVVLATTDGESVTARTILRISNGLTLYCLTGQYTRKYKQVTENPSVAIAYGNLQIEGRAIARGHPSDTENASFTEAYKEQYPDLYERSKKIHFQRPNMGLLEIVPSRVSLYHSANIAAGTESYIEILDVDKKEAHKVTRTSAGYDSPHYMK
ncbi:MAG: pyridoxamine 5'-phosphate oxidase family protein [Candidatus Bathyarchaeota archaeon]|nr:pyridoxamine 5'-phosphate oxidase family protein [Candidatus Bathyarchaeota archaeon]